MIVVVVLESKSCRSGCLVPYGMVVVELMVAYYKCIAFVWDVRLLNSCDVDLAMLMVLFLSHEGGVRCCYMSMLVPFVVIFTVVHYMVLHGGGCIEILGCTGPVPWRYHGGSMKV